MAKLFLLIGLACMLIVTSSLVYSAAMTCGTCKTKTGCTGNTCLFLTGELVG